MSLSNNTVIRSALGNDKVRESLANNGERLIHRNKELRVGVERLAWGSWQTKERKQTQSVFHSWSLYMLSMFKSLNGNI